MRSPSRSPSRPRAESAPPLVVLTPRPPCTPPPSGKMTPKPPDSPPPPQQKSASGSSSGPPPEASAKPWEELSEGFEWVWHSSYTTWCERRGGISHGAGWGRQPIPGYSRLQDEGWAKEILAIPLPFSLAQKGDGFELLRLADAVEKGAASAKDWTELTRGSSASAGNNACHYLAHNGGCGKKQWGIRASYVDSHTQVCTVGSFFFRSVREVQYSTRSAVQYRTVRYSTVRIIAYSTHSTVHVCTQSLI